jgi:hypothetical protein
MQMTQIMDKRFINFYETSKNTALSIKKIIQKMVLDNSLKNITL